MTWFIEGDRNTRFFHNHVNGKRQKLQLKRIQNGDSDWIENHEEIAKAAVEFYEKQFSQEEEPTDFSLLTNVPAMVAVDQNLELSRYPTLEEVIQVVFSLSGDSAGGPNRFTRTFYQEFWDIIGFVKGRSIFEKILLTQEIVTDIRLGAKPANVVIKLDMTKAYYRSTGFFKSSRGVKQGDPLSLTLFIMLAEVLSRSLNKLFDDKSFVGFGMPKWTDPLNHLAYADDTIIFASAHAESLKNIMEVLNGYENIFGQLINKTKCSYYMHARVSNTLVQSVEDIIGFSKGLGALYHLVPPDHHIDEELQEVAKLRQRDGWNEQLIDQSFPEDIVDKIK
ncbi:uncharacterized protein LOC142178353 [Nicotiana tabacum]|uniref:Uncharacterized protein LOC142178353 n=1 Tax=Nicotiana tabacum TaxID=4097 RepID=A0AC58U2T4_TOBAC